MVLGAGNSCLRLTLVLALALFASACDDENGPSRTVTELSFCEEEAPVWFAVQDGDGPWTRLVPVREGVYHVTLTTGRGGVAYVGRYGYGLVVNYGLVAELGSIECRLGYRTIYGNVQNAGIAEAWLGGGEGGTDGDLRLAIYGVAAGPQDLFAGRTYTTPGVRGPDRIILRRDQDVPTGERMPLLDFESSEAFEPAIVNVGAIGIGGASASVSSTFRGNQGSLDVPLSFSNEVATGPVPMLMIPAARLQPGELTSVTLSTGDDTAWRDVVLFVSDPSDLAIVPGPTPSVPVVSRDVIGPALHPRALLPSQAEYGRMASARFVQDIGGAVITVTAGYLGGTPQPWDLALPDLSSVEGWSDGWNLDPTLSLSWAVSAAGGVNLALGDVVHGGNQFQRGTAYGSDFPPEIRALQQSGRSRSWGFPSFPRRPAH